MIFIASTLLFFFSPAHSQNPGTLQYAEAPMPPELEKAKAELVAGFDKKDYFKNASCREIADGLLTHYGLPKLGEHKAIKGRRGTVNRIQEKKDPPVFNDEITADKNPVTVKLSATKHEGKEWRLNLIREVADPNPTKRFSTETQFQFKESKCKKKIGCELMKLTFTVKRTERDKPAAQGNVLNSVYTTNCLDFFIVDALISAKAKDKDAQNRQDVAWLREDCAYGMHYSYEAKQLVSKRRNIIMCTFD